MEDLASLDSLARPAEEGLADEDTVRRSSCNSRVSPHSPFLGVMFALNL